MARGYIYHISTDAGIYGATPSFDEKDYYDKLDVLGLDHVGNMSEDESFVALTYLMDSFKNFGAAVGYNDGGDYTYEFRFDQAYKVKEGYFSHKLTQLKQKVANLSLDSVIREAPDLDCICNNCYGDLVEYSDGLASRTLTMDDFIRYIEDGVTYQVYKKVVLAH